MTHVFVDGKEGSKDEIRDDADSGCAVHTMRGGEGDRTIVSGRVIIWFGD